MKKVHFLITLLSFCMLGCTLEKVLDDNEIVETLTSEITNDDHCFYTNLIAGQHYVAGSVTMDIDGDNLIITYTTNDEWNIGITHLSLGNCDEDWVPLTRSGNPRIGNFEYTEPFSSDSNEVVYIISLDGLDDNICFAAHAEVEGPTGQETAWAEGTTFTSKGWAMFAEVNLSDCTEEDDDDDTNMPF